MAARTYTCGLRGKIKRLDNLSGLWLDISLSSDKPRLFDIKTDPTNGDKVYVVGSDNTIAVSTTAGNIWLTPGGNYTSVQGIVFYEVWPVSSNIIYACGTNGYVVKSTDGGLTFNLLTTLPTPTGSPGSGVAYSLHFISATEGVVTYNDSVFRTTNGGITWAWLNGGAAVNSPKNILNFTGVHLSQNGQVIVALGTGGIYRSVNSGISFSLVFDFTMFEGIHLTWTDDLRMWATGVNNTRIFSTDGGVSWSVINPYVAGLLLDDHAAHMYTPTEGFFCYGEEVNATNNAMFTGTLSDVFPQRPVQAIWTSYIAPTCYQLTDCSGSGLSIVVSNDLSTYVGQSIIVCAEDIPDPGPPPGGDPVIPDEDPCNNEIILRDCAGIRPSVYCWNNINPALIYYIPSLATDTCWRVTDADGSQDITMTCIDLAGAVQYDTCRICTSNVCPPPVLTECTCFSVSIAENCACAIELLNIGPSYPNCQACSVPCYELVDCSNDENVIITGTDLSEYVGQVIQVLGCGDTCWLVGESDVCTGAKEVTISAGPFVDCATCLPPVVVPPPLAPTPRYAEPNVVTKGCPPELVEKYNCAFADEVWKVVKQLRYGIYSCCEGDLEKATIKKDLVDLEAIYDPELCKPVPVCPEPCCPPCNVTATLFVFTPAQCLATSRVSVTLNLQES